MIKEQIYNGVQHQAAPVAQVPVAQHVIDPALAKGMIQVAQNIDGVFMRGIQMEDAKHEFEAERELQAIGTDTENEVEAMLNKPDGKDGALFDEQGAIRQEVVLNLNDRVQQRLAKIGQNIIDPERREAMQRRALLQGDRILEGLGSTWERVARQKAETAWKDAYDLAVAKGNFGEAIGMLGRGVDMGLFSKDRAEVMKLGLVQQRERKKVAAVRAAGTQQDGRVLTAEIMQNLREVKPAPETGVDVSGLVSTVGAPAETAEEILTLKDPGLGALPNDELMAGFNAGQRLADSGSVTLSPDKGILEYTLPESAGESTQKIAGVAQAFEGYSLDDYNKSISKVAASYFSDDRMSGMSDSELVSALVDEVHMDGAADAWFGGDELAYKGWLQTQLGRMLVARGSGAVRKADRILVGDEGREALNTLLKQEVTDDEIFALSHGFNAVAHVAKNGIRDKQEKLTPQFRLAVQEYETHRERWKKELEMKEADYKPSDEDTPAKRFKDDWQEFSKWYMKQEDLYKTRRDALVEGVRDVYRQRAVDAIATLRETGSYQVGREVVKLDGTSDWAQEEKVLRHVLRQPLTDAELGSAKALVTTKEKLYQKRKDRAARYAEAATQHREQLQGKQEAIAAEKEHAKQEQEAKEELDKVLKQADEERRAGYGRRVERVVKFGSLPKEGVEREGDAPLPEPAVVIVPHEMYAEAADSLGATRGLYAFLPGVDNGLPVMAGDVDSIQINAPTLNLLDGKKNKLTGPQLRALANDGIKMSIQFGAMQKL